MSGSDIVSAGRVATDWRLRLRGCSDWSGATRLHYSGILSDIHLKEPSRPPSLPLEQRHFAGPTWA